LKKEGRCNACLRNLIKGGIMPIKRLPSRHIRTRLPIGSEVEAVMVGGSIHFHVPQVNLLFHRFDVQKGDVFGLEDPAGNMTGVQVMYIGTPTNCWDTSHDFQFLKVIGQEEPAEVPLAQYLNCPMRVLKLG